MDLEDFLNGPGSSVQSTGEVDLNAYEALWKIRKNGSEF
jgi:uncharacterized membrane protein